MPLTAFFIGCSDDQPSPVQQGAKQESGINRNHDGMQTEAYQSGTHDGYFWSLWTSDGLTGSVNYSNGSGGNYSVSWNCNGNFTCGKGWSTGSLTRIVGYNCGAYSQSGGGGSFGYYGWSRNPLREYYVNEKWPGSRPTGTSMGTINSDGGTYNLYRNQRVNAPSIDGTQTFWQIFSTRTSQNSTGQNHTITFANHANAWASAGWGLGSDLSPAAILLTEAWGQSNGYANATVWSAGSSGGSSSGSSSGGGGNYNISVRARGTNGSEQIRLKVGGTTIATWTLTTSMVTRTASTSLSGGILVEFFNDASGRDVQVDYIQVPSGTWQAENQSYNTGVWQNNNCGGSNSEWLQCNGAIGFSAYR
ncbi:MAG: glycoside hydrolase family 11 protein [Ignavibacteria bacterium]